jgi:O-antigen/teichoic acid export membrane protein
MHLSAEATEIQREIPLTPPVNEEAGTLRGQARSLRNLLPARSALTQVISSLGDQGLAVGGGFLANVALARSLTKEDYGIFALTYSVFTFLLGLYYAAILEPCTVYGSGRYRERFSEYLRLILRTNAILCACLTGILLLVCVVVSQVAPHWATPAVWGLALTAGVLLSGYLLRRLFYVQRQPALAAMSSLVFFLVLLCELWLMVRAHRIDSFTIFVALALGWIVAWAVLGRRLHFGRPKQSFLSLEPEYWREHWKYSKWVFATAFVFQFTQQGYYWVVGAFLSAPEVANLRAIYLLVGPIEQIFIALSYLIVPALAARYAAKEMHQFLSIWKRYALATVGVSALYALATRIAGKYVVHTLYAGKYDGLAPYLFTLTFVPLVLWVGTTMGHALNSVEKPKFQFWAFVVGAGATFLLGIPLVIRFGLWGAVYGMLLSSGTYTLTLAIGFLLMYRDTMQNRAL